MPSSGQKTAEECSISNLLLPGYKPTPSSGLIGSGCMCVAVGVTVQIGTGKISKERKEDRGACVSCAER